MFIKSAKYPKILGPNSGQSGHVFVAAHGRFNDLQIGGCMAPFAMDDEPNGELRPTPTPAHVHIPTYNKGETHDVDNVLPNK